MNRIKLVMLSMVMIAFMFSCSDSTILSLKTDTLQLDISDNGAVTSIKDIASGVEYIAQGVYSPVVALRVDTTYVNPQKAEWNDDNGVLKLSYENDITLDVSILPKDGYYVMEITNIDAPSSKHIDLAIWGPYPTTISRTIGECVGVVRDSVFAFGIRALNPKTIGGYPSTEDDVDPSFDIFATNSLVDVPDSTKVLYRGQAARHTDFGSVVQAYVRNRNKDRVVEMWQHDRFIAPAPAYYDGGVMGSKIAIFGSPEIEILNMLEKIVVGENLPYPQISGEWNKKSPDAAAAYIIYPFNETNIDAAIEFTKRTGLKYLYHGGPFKTWGHFELNPSEFPSGMAGLQACVDKASAEGIKLGVHTLSNFTTVTDKYVTPVPDSHLAKVGSSAIVSDINATDKEIVIENPDFFNQMKNNSLHGVMIGGELVRYEKVSDSAPWRLLNCQRGAWGTTASSHTAGSEISKLLDHPYNVFLTDIDLTKEQALNIADIFNNSGAEQISFDGLEGAWSTGLGQYGLSLMMNEQISFDGLEEAWSTGLGQYGYSLMMKEWWDHLRPELRNNINDASITMHYNWTIFTRMNWGEPWYAGFRESQMNYRLMNQDFYRRNLIPNMLGWFKYGATTSIEDVNWLLARSAAFDAGYTLVTSGKEVAENGESDKIIDAIRGWENARLSLAFPDYLKLEMEHVANEYRLEEVTAKSWNLYPYSIDRFTHKNITRQPGEPVVTRHEFKNSNDRQPLQFIIKATDDISNISITIGGYSTLTIEGKLLNGQIIRYEGADKIDIIDANRNVVRSVAVDASQLSVDKGETTIKFACNFTSADVEKAATIELRGCGNPIELTAKRDRK